MEYLLQPGMKSLNGQIEIIDIDRISLSVKNSSKGAIGIRTISKSLLAEYVSYFKQHQNASPSDARETLAGHTAVDKFEYGYTSTLTTLAKMVLGLELSDADKTRVLKPHKSDKRLQIIYYGAPGTGKSFTIDDVTDDKNSVRTTFHPDSDYASFVGAYKPTMASVPINAFVGTTVHHAKNAKAEDAYEQKIVYKYVPQAFLKAYVAAWSNLNDPYFLVIEEINRGNCAQIFGDLFQLLDRNNMGCSSYAIHADEDISQFLKDDSKGFALLSNEQKAAISAFKLIKDNGKTQDVGQDILDGKLLLLPPNLHIWATMNTSDQSLFPIDSAFKRRWNWKYMPIEYHPIDKHTGQPIDWKFRIGENIYSWGEFLSKINPEIYTLTESSDKQMGYFFAKADPATGEISEDVFLNKVLFYLWTDVFKDYAMDSNVFRSDELNRPFRFTDFFENNAHIVMFLKNLGLEPIDDEELDKEEAGGIAGDSKLIISFPDGSTYQGKTQFDSYLQALEAIGLENCEPIAATKKYKRHNSPLITKEPAEEVLADKTYSYIQCGDYYVVKGINTKTKINLLNQISDELGLGLKITRL